MRPEYDSVVNYKWKSILCTSGRNVQDKEELKPLCHKDVTTGRVSKKFQIAISSTFVNEGHNCEQQLNCIFSCGICTGQMMKNRQK